MAITQPWNIVFLLGFVLYVAIRGHYARQTRSNENAVTQVDVPDRILLAAVVGTSLLLPVLYLFTPLLHFADYELPGWLHACGLVVMIPALWLFQRSHRDLGLNWSVTLELRKGHRLVREGVYRSIRHPMYAAIGLWNLSQALLLDNWLAGWSALLAFACLYARRAPREEAMMRDHFGEEYEAYCSETGRLLPRFRPGKRA